MGLALACHTDKKPSQVVEKGSQEIETKEEEAHEEDREYLVPDLDYGLLQSPINILSSQTVQGNHNVTFNFTGEIDQIENLGHTVQLDFSEGNTITVDEKTFAFKQLHFHIPSEHLIDGMTYPMEMHFVNTRVDEAEDGNTEFLVIAALFKMGNENRFIGHFIDQIPEEKGSTDPININLENTKEAFAIDLDKVINSYYSYKGSLTTPPYTERVTWCVLKQIFEASPAQILKLNGIIGDNARHIQAKSDRKISG